MSTHTALLSPAAGRSFDLRPADPSAGRGLKFDHIDTMLSEYGLWQHADGHFPDRRFGYSIDDEARALIVAIGYWNSFPEGVRASERSPLSVERRSARRDSFAAGDLMRRMGQASFQFIEQAACPVAVGRFHNFRDAAGGWLDTYGSSDSLGRTLWALGVAAQANAPFAPRERAERLMRRSLPTAFCITSPRAMAFTILGLAACGINDALVRRLANRLADGYDRAAEDGWHWFEDSMTYCNARLPQAMFAASMQCSKNRRRYIEIGTAALDFLLHVTRNVEGSYAPIGNEKMANGNWFRKGQARPPVFDQQPVDAGALVECCVTAFAATADIRYLKAAYEAHSWYFGWNVHNVSVYDPDSGGVADAITRKGLNCNMGAESVLSIHLAHLALNQLEGGARTAVD